MYYTMDLNFEQYPTKLNGYYNKGITFQPTKKDPKVLVTE